MIDERLELIVDNDDKYLEVENVFYINPNRLALVRCLSDAQFNSCLIKNSSIDNLTSMNFSYILRKLKPLSQCEVIIYQPITVMQEYDAKQVEANAKLAGFVDFETDLRDFVDNRTDKKFKTLVVSFTKPTKNPNEIEVEVVISSKNVKGGKSSKGSEVVSKGKTGTTTTSSYSTSGPEIVNKRTTGTSGTTTTTSYTTSGPQVVTSSTRGGVSSSTSGTTTYTTSSTGSAVTQTRKK